MCADISIETQYRRFAGTNASAYFVPPSKIAEIRLVHSKGRCVLFGHTHAASNLRNFFTVAIVLSRICLICLAICKCGNVNSKIESSPRRSRASETRNPCVVERLCVSCRDVLVLIRFMKFNPLTRASGSGSADL